MIDAGEICFIEYDGPCIYCSDKNRLENEILTDEHVVPESLGGRFVLRRSSCAQCACKISKCERFLARSNLDVMRKRFNVRQKKKRREPRKPFLLALRDDGWHIEFVEYADFPLGFQLPKFYDPDILADGPIPKSDLLSFKDNPFYTYEDVDRLRQKIGARRIEVPFIGGEFFIFSRVIAKIAHSFAFSQLGENGFHPLLNRHILGIPSVVPPHHFFGDAESPRKSEDMHQLSLHTLIANKRIFKVVYVNLFAKFGLPAYRVVVGFDKSEDQNRPFIQLNHFRDIFPNVVITNPVPAFGVGPCDFICGKCKGLVIRGIQIKTTFPVRCPRCASVCLPNLDDKIFRMPKIYISEPDPSPKNNDLEENPDFHRRIQMFGHGVGARFHIVSWEDGYREKLFDMRSAPSVMRKFLEHAWT